MLVTVVRTARLLGFVKWRSRSLGERRLGALLRSSRAAMPVGARRGGQHPALPAWRRSFGGSNAPRLEEWIARLYGDTEQFIDDHPFPGGDKQLPGEGPMS
jgi:hypothetical protein